MKLFRDTEYLVDRQGRFTKDPEKAGDFTIPVAMKMINQYRVVPDCVCHSITETDECVILEYILDATKKLLAYYLAEESFAILERIQ